MNFGSSKPKNERAQNTLCIWLVHVSLCCLCVCNILYASFVEEKFKLDGYLVDFVFLILGLECQLFVSNHIVLVRITCCCSNSLWENEEGSSLRGKIGHMLYIL